MNALLDSLKLRPARAPVLALRQAVPAAARSARKLPAPAGGNRTAF